MSHYTISYEDKDGDGHTIVRRRKPGPALATAADARNAGKVNISILDHVGAPISEAELAIRVEQAKDA